LDLHADLETVASNKTIGLFGAETKTGQHFLRVALDAGYHVQALQLPNYFPHQHAASAIASDNDDHDGDYPQNLEWVRGDSLYDPQALALVVKGAQYVVCLANYHESAGPAMNDNPAAGPPPAKQQHHQRRPEQPATPHLPIDAAKPMACFIQLLYPILKQQPSLKVFLFQANSLASDTKGHTPVFSKVLKSARTAGALANNVLRNRSNHQHHHHANHGNGGATATAAHCDILADLDSCIHEIAVQHKRSNAPQSQPRAQFAYIVTRPTTLLHDGPSRGRVAASKSQPGVCPIRHVDLAVFSLNALLKRRLYHSCPYVVADHHHHR
jgi:hypothetical protein